MLGYVILALNPLIRPKNLFYIFYERAIGC